MISALGPSCGHCHALRFRVAIVQTSRMRNCFVKSAGQRGTSAAVWRVSAPPATPRCPRRGKRERGEAPPPGEAVGGRIDAPPQAAPLQPIFAGLVPPQSHGDRAEQTPSRFRQRTDARSGRNGANAPGVPVAGPRPIPGWEPMAALSSMGIIDVMGSADGWGRLARPREARDCCGILLSLNHRQDDLQNDDNVTGFGARFGGDRVLRSLVT
jgi:hypothetical protein